MIASLFHTAVRYAAEQDLYAGGLIIERIYKTHGGFRIFAFGAHTHTVCRHIQTGIVISPPGVIGSGSAIHIIIQRSQRHILSIQLGAEFIGFLPSEGYSHQSIAILVSAGKRLIGGIVTGQSLLVYQPFPIQFGHKLQEILITVVHRIVLDFPIFHKISVCSPVGKLNSHGSQKIRQGIGTVKPCIVSAISIEIQRYFIIRITISIGVLFLKCLQYLLQFGKRGRRFPDCQATPD